MKKEKNRTPDKEGAKQPSPKEAISEALKECLDDLTSCDTVEFFKMQEDNKRLQEENIRLESDISFWKPLACGALSTLFSIFGAAIGFYIMIKIGIL